MWKSYFHERFSVNIVESDSYWFSVVITKKAVLRAFYSCSTNFWQWGRQHCTVSSTQLARPTEDFRERRKPETLPSCDFARRSQPCTANANTRPFAHVIVFDSISETGWAIEVCSNLFKFVPGQVPRYRFNSSFGLLVYKPGLQHR